ncbi:MAG: hypothetical protein NC432_08240 [Roseburia sp.]|nr:hypothetical protein [Roseburia sp.]MCM1098677.1 hypothetical protein [Ruminococcus flavefaciens]
MKKSAILAAVCFLAALCSIPALAVCIDREKEAVQITEISLFGDPGEASGIRLEYGVQWSRKLLWDTVYLTGSGETESAFSFSSEGEPWEQRQREGVDWMGVGGWGTSSSSPGGVDLDEVYFSAMVKAAASRVAPGETRSEEIRLADYYDYYPFYLTVESERRNLFWGYYYESATGADSLAGQVGLPVSERDRVMITITKDEGGNCLEVSSRLIMDEDEAENETGSRDMAEEETDRTAEKEFFRTLDGAFGDRGLYLCYGFSATEKAEGGWGVFYIPYTDQPEARGRYSGVAVDAEITLDIGQSRRVWEAESDGVELVDLAWDETAGQLYLVGAQDGKESLYILRKEGEELRLSQQIPLAERTGARATESWGWGGMRLLEGGLLLAWERNAQGSGSFLFLTEKDGLFSIFCRGNFPGVSRESSEEYGSLFPNEYCCDFDGERLVLAAFDTWQGVDAWVGVFRREGMTYLGMYEHSGSRERGRNETSEIYPVGGLAGYSRPEEPLKLEIVRE